MFQILELSWLESSIFFIASGLSAEKLLVLFFIYNELNTLAFYFLVCTKLILWYSISGKVVVYRYIGTISDQYWSSESGWFKISLTHAQIHMHTYTHINTNTLTLIHYTHTHTHTPQTHVYTHAHAHYSTHTNSQHKHTHTNNPQTNTAILMCSPDIKTTY